tara:strand:- start:227 stop:406 length:180 start_codon:yes stop_codon:yes gene_type:complete
MTDFTNSKFLYDEDGKTKTHIQTDLGSSRFRVFPINVENATYQEYLAWVAEGNTIEEAD